MLQCAAWSGLLHTSGASDDYEAMLEWLSTGKNRRNSQQQLLIYVLQISHEVNWDWTWGSWWEARILSPELWHDHSLQHMVLDRTLPRETAQAIKACRLRGGKLHSFLTSTLDEGQWSTSGLGCFSPGEKPQVSIKWVVGLPLGLVWMLCRRESHLLLPESEPWVIQSLA
jgi:hypothetical protein